MSDLADRTCLVTGASGFVGGWVVERLLEHGARVRCLVRSTSNRSFLPLKQVELALGDVNDLVSLEKAAAGCDYVFHVAGLIKAREPSEYLRVNCDGTRKVLEAVRSRGQSVRRVVILSSLAAFGPSRPGHAVDESWEPRPFSPYGESKLLAEKVARTFEADVPITVVRPPSVYGPRDREMLQVMRIAGMPIRPRLSNRGAISTIHVSDLVNGILLAATNDAATGKAYFIAGDEMPTLDELLRQVSRAVGKRGWSIGVPDSLILAGGYAAEVSRHLTGRVLTFDRWKAREVVLKYWACSNGRAKAELGFAPRYSLDDGLTDTARWYRTNGWLD